MTSLKPGVAFTLHAILLVIVAFIYSNFYFNGLHWDVTFYFEKSLEFLSSEEDANKRLEYPLFALIPILLPHVFRSVANDFHAYKVIFMMQNVIWLCLSLYLAYRELERLKYRNITGRLIIMAAITLPFQVVFLRMDMFPAMLTLLSFLAFLHRRYFWSGVFLMLGIATKLYPVVLVPLFGMILLVWWDWKAIGRFVAGLLTPVIGIVLVWTGVLGKEPAGLLAFLAAHQERGIQVESLAATVVYLAHFLKGFPLKSAYVYGADHLVLFSTKAILEVLLTMYILLKFIFIVLSGAVFRDVSRKPDHRTTSLLAGYVTAAFLLFMLANKVFSPQYLIWLIPFLCFLRMPLLIGFLVIFLLSSLLFPFLYDQIREFAMPGLGLIILRNLLCVAMLITLCIPPVAWRKYYRRRS